MHTARCSLKINGVRVVHGVCTCDAQSLALLYLDPSPEYKLRHTQKDNFRSEFASCHTKWEYISDKEPRARISDK
jgi:hypothetical protein